MAKPTSKAKRKSPSKPSAFDPAIAAEFCNRIAAGRSITQVAKDPDMPTRDVFNGWREQHPELDVACARARHDRAEHSRDRMNEITKKLEEGKIDAHTANVLLSQERWNAQKDNPRLYGDKVDMTLNAEVAVKTVPDDKLDGRISSLLAKLGL